MEMRLEANRVYLVTVDDETKRRREAHIVRLNKDMVCVAFGPHAKGDWESCHDFAKRDPKPIGWLQNGFLCAKKYVYDPPPDIREVSERIDKVERERRKAVEALGKANATYFELQTVVDAIVKSAVRDEKHHQWVIRDEDLVENDPRAEARKRLPR